MRYYALLVFAMATLLFSACKKTNLQEEITQLEAEVKQSFDGEKAAQLVEKYSEYVKENPDSVNCPLYLKQAANLEYRAGNYDKSAKLFQQALQSYFESPDRNELILSLATINMLNLRDETNGKALADNFASSFPSSVAMEKINGEVLDDMKTKLFNEQTQKIDKKNAAHYINLGEIFGMALKDPEKSASRLMETANIARSVGLYQRAADIYRFIHQNQPQSEKAPQAFFLEGFTFQEHLDREEEAGNIYREFLEKYPDDAFADDVQFLLNNLGKSDEEIISSFEKKK